MTAGQDRAEVSEHGLHDPEPPTDHVGLDWLCSRSHPLQSPLVVLCGGLPLGHGLPVCAVASSEGHGRRQPSTVIVKL